MKKIKYIATRVQRRLSQVPSTIARRDSVAGSPSTRVGITERHGMLLEQMKNPAPGVSYQTARRRRGALNRVVRSPIKDFLPVIDDPDIDLVEAVISPAVTRLPWICSLANFQEAMAFNALGMPLPRVVKRHLLEPIFRADNFLGFTFWSEAGRRTMLDYGGITDPQIIEKARVVYPAVGVRNDRRIDGKSPRMILFQGDFFRKGGVHVVDAFERLQARHPDLTLRLCSDIDIDFHTRDSKLRERYLHRIISNPSILIGRESRDIFLDETLPRSAVYVVPTYDETFGFAILEALAAGVPVLATREFAIPEMLDHGINGWLLPYSQKEKDVMMDGYTVRHIPLEFHERISEGVFDVLNELFSERVDYLRMVREAQQTARTRFSFETRNRDMAKLYQLS
jgi:glycosyltransferase involved in cell wall biosynthesis